MEHSENIERKKVKRPFTLFGEPIIKTRCQRNTLISGISGGILSGLVAFLCTSRPQKSTFIAFSSCVTITFCMSCYCAYEEYTLRKQARLIKKAMYEINSYKNSQQSSNLNVEVESK